MTRRRWTSALRSRLTFANAIALIALFVSLGGTVYAAATINGKTIRKNSIPADRVKKDSLTGVQVNEGALATVPSAASAASATKATTAERAASAERAESAAKAESAATAARADLASEAEHAQAADSAPAAPNARSLGGKSAASYVRDCGDGAIKAAAVVTLNNRREPVASPQFNCTGGAVTPRKVNTGEYIVTVDGIAAGIPSVTSANQGAVASVSPVGVGEFRVVVFFVQSASSPSESPFTIVVH